MCAFDVFKIVQILPDTQSLSFVWQVKDSKTNNQKKKQANVPNRFHVFSFCRYRCIIAES